MKNLDLIDQFNDEEDGATYGLNEYAHLCHHEFKAHKGGLLHNQNRTKKYVNMEPKHLLVCRARTGLCSLVPGGPFSATFFQRHGRLIGM